MNPMTSRSSTRATLLCAVAVLGACDLSNTFSFLSGRSSAATTAQTAASSSGGQGTTHAPAHGTTQTTQTRSSAFAASTGAIAGVGRNVPAIGNMSFSRTETHTVTHTTGPAARSSREGGGSEQQAGPTCNGDFTLGSMSVVCSNCGLGQACNNPNAPTNCADGMYIQMGGECRCIARCSSFGVGLGQSCADGWTCRHIRATNSMGNRATVCVPDQWNVCQGDPNAPSQRRRSLRDDD